MCVCVCVCTSNNSGTFQMLTWLSTSVDFATVAVTAWLRKFYLYEQTRVTATTKNFVGVAGNHSGKECGNRLLPLIKCAPPRVLLSCCRRLHCAAVEQSLATFIRAALCSYSCSYLLLLHLVLLLWLNYGGLLDIIPCWYCCYCCWCFLLCLLVQQLLSQWRCNASKSSSKRLIALWRTGGGVVWC